MLPVLLSLTLGLIPIRNGLVQRVAPSATPTSGANTSPSVAFLDDRPLVLDFDRLQAGQAVVIYIRNASAATQTVRLRVVGLEAPAGEADPSTSSLLPRSIEQSIGPLDAQPFVLTFTLPAARARPAPGSYQGLLEAAIPPTGTVVTRPFTVQVVAVPALAHVDAVTLPGVNYLPSPLNPLFPTLCWIVTALIFLWLLLRGARQPVVPLAAAAGNQPVPAQLITRVLAVLTAIRDWPAQPRARVALLVLGLAVLITGALTEVTQGSGPRLPAVTIVALHAPASPRAVLGTVTAPDGSLATILLDRGSMSVTGIQRAGVYQGTISLAPGADGRTIKLTINVADWWLYALLTIAAGVWIGYRITRYVKQQRVATQQEIRRARVWQRITDDESRFQHEHGNESYARYSMIALAQQWLAHVGQLDGDPAIANQVDAQLAGLDQYADHFAQFRLELVGLASLHTRVWSRIQAEPFGLAQGQMVALATGNLFDGQSFVMPPEDEQGAFLAQRRAAVQEAAARLQALETAYGLVVEALRVARQTDTQGWDPNDVATLQQQTQRLEALGSTVLLAPDTAQLQQLDTQAGTAFATIMQLRDDNQAPNIGGLHFLAVAMPAVQVAVAVPAQPQVTDSTCTVQTPDGSVQGTTGNLDDLFTFAITVSFPQAPPGDHHLHWDYNDGGAVSPIQVVPANTQNMALTTSHRFAASNAHTVALVDDGVQLRTCAVNVGPAPGRLERLVAAFRLSEWQVTVATGLLTVISGFLALYFVSPNWGTPQDYLKALLWGSALSEGLKYVGGVVGRVWPSA